VFQLTPACKLTNLYVFKGDVDGGNPNYGVVRGADGTLYGVTAYGGADPSKSGTIFSVSPSGAQRTLYSFSSSIGYGAASGLTFGSDGALYGMAVTGTAGSGYGFIYRITTAGSFSVIYNFGYLPDEAQGVYSLALGKDGKLYGSVCQNFVTGQPSKIFSVTTSGQYQVLYSYPSFNDQLPLGPFAMGADGSVYGVQDNNVFQLSSGGTMTTLHTFTGTAGGIVPMGVTLNAAGNHLYGANEAGGRNHDGTLFQITLQ
jgi:uncharacterized repeat protein (TIGR03803 family)